MRVYTDKLGSHDEDDDVIVVKLDDGSEVGCFLIVEDPETERIAMCNMIRLCILEAFDKSMSIYRVLPSSATARDAATKLGIARNDEDHTDVITGKRFNND